MSSQKTQKKSTRRRYSPEYKIAAMGLAGQVGGFKRHGVKVDRVLTDNGGCYRSHLFKTACWHLGARPKKTRPYTPRTNGQAGRFIQTSIKEWAHSQAYESSAERADHLAPLLNYYNNQRPHTALNYQPPISRLTKCEQRPC